MLLSLASSIPRWVWAALVAALAATSCKLTIDLGSVKLELQKAKTTIAANEAMYEAERASASLALAEKTIMVQEAEQAIVVAQAFERRRADEQVRAARIAADSLRERLRIYTADSEPAAATYSLAAAPAAARPFAPGSVGALLRDEAADAARQLIGEAARADTIRAHLHKCYADYDAAREAIDELRTRMERTD
jgi:hypothetical protein